MSVCSNSIAPVTNRNGPGLGGSGSRQGKKVPLVSMAMSTATPRASYRSALTRGCEQHAHPGVLVGRSRTGSTRRNPASATRWCRSPIGQQPRRRRPRDRASSSTRSSSRRARTTSPRRMASAARSPQWSYPGPRPGGGELSRGTTVGRGSSPVSTSPAPRARCLRARWARLSPPRLPRLPRCCVWRQPSSAEERKREVGPKARLVAGGSS